MLLPWLFTPQCAACEIPADTLCDPCGASLEPVEAACPRCGEATRDAAVCERCRSSPLPLVIASPWRYGGALAVAIQRLKFHRASHVARTVAPLWAPVIAAAAGRDGIVVPVPLHWRRRLVRGFDHAWLLAAHACREAGLPRPAGVLRRIRATPAQSTLPAARRHANVVDAFEVRDRRRIAGRTVVLVDDVATTGATLAAAAGAVLAAGACDVVGVSLARATCAPG